jgi:hypothetical protein
MRLAGVFFAFIILTFVYLIPGSTAMVEGRTDTVMSDDTDPAALPYMYDQLVQVAKNQPSRLFYGSVYFDTMDPHKGFPYWMSWSERFTALTASTVLPVEQISTAVVFIMMLLNAIFMFLLARSLGWNIWISSGLAIAWAFNPFTRARGKVHQAMAGIFHLPLIFLGLTLVARGRDRLSLAAAALAFLVACTNNHYFVVTALFCSPFFLAYLFLEQEARKEWKINTARLAVAVLPAMLFLGWCFTHPIPGDAKIAAGESMPASGQTPDGSLHPFLNIYAAHPIDYLAGDIALQPLPLDINPLRVWISGYIVTSLNPSNPLSSNTHERTNGIRWIILLLAAFSLYGIRRASDKRLTLFFCAFGAFSFLLSLSPESTFGILTPSAWIYKMVSQVRVPSRAGVQVHFALLMLVGFWLSYPGLAGTRTAKLKRFLLLPAVFPLLMLIDYPPFLQNVPMVPMRPRYAALQRDKGACGAGMYFPFVSNSQLSVLYYQFLQQLRGTDCVTLDSTSDVKNLYLLGARFPATMDFLTGLDKNLVAADQLNRLARCVPLSFIAFDPHVPEGWRQKVCGQMGWTLNPDLTCVSPQKGQPLQRMPDECI